MAFNKRVLLIGEGIEMYEVLGCGYTTLRIDERVYEVVRW